MIDGEKNLIKRAIKGEAEAFGLLYDRYQPRIYRFIYLKVSHREEAEDLTHQVFLNSWKRIGDYRFQGFPFSSWLYRIARNEIIDYYRTKKEHAELDDYLSNDSLDAEDENSLSYELDIIFDLEKIKKAIKELRPLEQDVLILRFVEDFSPEEVARVIEKAPGAVRLLQHRAIKNLRNILKSNANGKQSN